MDAEFFYVDGMGWVIRLADREADLIALPHFEFARAGCVVLVVVISNGDFVERGMGGDLSAQSGRSVGGGGGSTFVLTLPRAVSEPQPH